MTIVAGCLNNLQETQDVSLKALESRFYELLEEGSFNEYEFCINFLALTNLSLDSNQFNKIKKYLHKIIPTSNSEQLTLILNSLGKLKLKSNIFDLELWNKVNERLSSSLKLLPNNYFLSVCNCIAVSSGPVMIIKYFKNFCP